MDKHNDYEHLEDLELIALVRDGDGAAYSELWSRHNQTGLYMARSFSSSFDPEDVVAEAHSRIFKALQDGKGPTSHFRPYLVTTIQNISRRWGQTQGEATVMDFDEILETSTEAIGDFTDTSLDKLTLQRAFKSLPERWQQVLWHTEVEGGTTKELADSLGIGNNTAAALTYRAKEGLKQAWIDAHLPQDITKTECQYTVRRLGAYERGTLSKKAAARVEAHLATCVECSKVQVEARRVSQALKSALLPTILAGAVAAGAAKVAFTSTPAAAVQASATSSGKFFSGALLHASPKALAVVASSIAVLATAGVIATTQFEAQTPEVQTTSTATQAEQGRDPEPQHAGSNDEPSSVSKEETTQPAVSSMDNLEVIPGQETPLFFVSGPAAPHFHAEDGSILAGPDAELTGSALPKARVNFFISGNQTGYRTETVLANDAGGWHLQLSNLPEGEYDVRAYQTNAQGQRSALTSANYSVRWDAPEDAPVVEAMNTENGTLAPLVSGTGTPGNTVQVLLNGIATTDRIGTDGTWSVQANKGALVGTNELSVQQYSPRTKTLSQSTDPVEFQLRAPDLTFTSEQPGFIALTITSVPRQSVQVIDVDGNFSHTVPETTGSDSLKLSWRNTSSTESTTAVQVRYTADDGRRLGPVVTVQAAN